jgi:hypothetical protein
MGEGQRNERTGGLGQTRVEAGSEGLLWVQSTKLPILKTREV